MAASVVIGPGLLKKEEKQRVTAATQSFTGSFISVDTSVQLVTPQQRPVLREWNRTTRKAALNFASVPLLEDDSDSDLGDGSGEKRYPVETKTGSS